MSGQIELIHLANSVDVCIVYIYTNVYVHVYVFIIYMYIYMYTIYIYRHIYIYNTYLYVSTIPVPKMKNRTLCSAQLSATHLALTPLSLPGSFRHTRIA